MRTLAVNSFVTLDGVMQAPGGPHEDPVGGFTLGGWAANYWDEAMLAGLVQTLLRDDVIDELRIWTFPLVIGTGKRLFGDGTVPAAFKLADHEVTSTGVTIGTYERAGAVNPGSFEFDQPTDAELERRRRLAQTG